MEFLETAFQQLLGNSSESILNLANPKWDAVVFVFIFITTLFYGIGLTRNKILSFLFSSYIALAVMDSLPFISSWWSGLHVDSELNASFIFLAILIFIVAFIFSHIALNNYFSKEGSKGSMIQNFFLSFLHVGLLTNVILSSFPPEIAVAFSPFAQRLFIGDVARFFWFVLPLLTIIVFQKSAAATGSGRPITVTEEEENYREASEYSPRG